MPNTFTHFPYSGDGVTSIAAYFQALNAAHAGYGVLTGMEVSRTSASALAIAAGTYANGIPPSAEPYAGGTITGISAAASGKHRYDLVYLDTSDGTAKLAAGAPDTPSNAANFLENAVPQPGDLPDENAILLAVICVDDSGIVAGDHGSYSTAGVADMRLKLAVGTHLVSYLYDSGEARGDLITRKAAGWDRLATGTAGQYLQSQGAGADLRWDGLQISSLTVASEARGDLVVRGATAFGRLAPGSANRYLMSNGAAADLTYELLKIESLYHASEAQGCFPTKGAATWSVLAPGPAGYVLRSGGAGADLSWASIESVIQGFATEQTVVGRITGGSVTALSVAQLQTLALGAALPENVAIILDQSLSADGKYSGIVETGTAGDTISFGQVVYQSVTDDRWEKAKADAEATSKGRLGICVQASTDGNATTILLVGKVRADAIFPTFTKYAPVYISTATAGALTTTAPSQSTGHIVRVVGQAITGDELWFNPSADWMEFS